MSTTRRPDRFEPDRYLPSKSHPGYLRQETTYVVTHIFSDHRMERWQRKRAGAIPFREIEDVVASYLGHEIGQSWHPVPVGKGKVTFSGAEKQVIKAIELFGMDALGLSVVDELINEKNDTRDMFLETLKLKDQLGAEVCEVIRYWLERVLAGGQEERRKAASWLKEVFTALVPETRGKREKMLRVPPLEVQKFYYKELFRLYHIRHALRTGNGSKSERVRRASADLGLPVETIRDLWDLDEADNPVARPISVKEMARILTGRHFKITQHRLSNILAS